MREHITTNARIHYVISTSGLRSNFYDMVCYWKVYIIDSSIKRMNVLPCCNDEKYNKIIYSFLDSILKRDNVYYYRCIM